MYKSEIAPGLIRYLFDPLPGRHFSSSIYAIISGRKALLIDSGWEDEGAQIADDLKNSGLSLAGVIISHFHDDHMQGLKSLPKAPVYGSSRFKETLDMWTDREEHRYYTPSVAVEKEISFEFEGHGISLIPFPGHSECTMLTLIDGACLHIADEVMFSDNYEDILPGADPGCAPRHIDSLERLKAYGSYTLLPAHGRPFSGADEISRQADKRIKYLSAILEAGGRISYDEAVKDCGGFLHSEWHEYNCC